MYYFALTLAFITILLRLSSADTDNPVVDGFYPFILVYKNGTVQRNSNTTLVPPSPEDPITGVSSKDINISTVLPSRIYLPKLTTADQKLPIFIWFHGGGFFMGSAFADSQQAFLNIMASRAGAIAISVDYRLVPEHHLPTAYDDAWTALQWVTAHKTRRSSCGEPWLLQYGDFDRIFVGGDSAGANIVHNTLMRAGLERPKGSIKILGGIQTHPYFWGSNETCSIDWIQRFANFIWRFAFPTAPGGIDNPMVNPFTENLKCLGSSKLFVSVAGQDFLRDIGVRYVQAVMKSGWKGEVKLMEIEGVNHSFYFEDLHSDKAQRLITAMVSFIRQREIEESVKSTDPQENELYRQGDKACWHGPRNKANLGRRNKAKLG